MGYVICDSIGEPSNIFVFFFFFSLVQFIAWIKKNSF